MLSSILYQIALGWLLNVHFALAARLAERRSSDRLVVCHFIVSTWARLVCFLKTNLLSRWASWATATRQQTTMQT